MAIRFYIMLALLGVFALPLAGGAVSAGQTHAGPEPVISAQKLSEALKLQEVLLVFGVAKELKLIDVRRAEAFAAGHVPGAVNIPHDAMTVGRAQFADALKPGHHVVIYDERGGLNAARLFWLLNTYGHRKVSLLNGGLQAWRAAGFALSTAPRPC